MLWRVAVELLGGMLFAVDEVVVVVVPCRDSFVVGIVVMFRRNVFGCCAPCLQAL